MSPEQLPAGWAEIPPTQHPLDAGTPEDEWETTAHPRRPRTELRCWVRGSRYVRVCELAEGSPGERYALHYGKIDDEGKDKIYQTDNDLGKLVNWAVGVMRIGGYPR